MDLSIIIVSFNTKELLSDCLKSIQKATSGISSEVFIVDNNSSDGSVVMAQKNYPWVNLISNSQNLGFSRANNLALQKAKGKYILVLNPDTKLMTDTVTKMIEFMEKNKEVGVSTCKVQLPNGRLDRDCRRHFPTPWRAFCHFSGLSKLFSGSKIFDQYHMGYLSDKKQHEIDACTGAFMMVRASTIKKVGLFDEEFFFYGEDLDWCWRLKKAGYKIVYTPITQIIHYKGASSGIKSATQYLSKATRESKRRAIKESTRAMELFYKKHYIGQYPFILTWLILFAIKIIEKIRLFRA